MSFAGHKPFIFCVVTGSRARSMRLAAGRFISQGWASSVTDSGHHAQQNLSVEPGKLLAGFISPAAAEAVNPWQWKGGV
jgi:hypothetical protein